MVEILRHLLTGKDNETHDVARWSWVTTTLATIVGAMWDAIHNGNIDLMNFAQAIGILSGAHGAAVMMKRDSEPEPQ